MKKRNTTKYWVTLAMFLAIGVCLNFIETLVPIPIPVPGVKLGLANLMTLIVLYFYSPKEYLLVGLLRVTLSGLLWSGIMSYGFFLSLGGWALSSIITIVLYLIFKRVSIYGLSVSSACFHCFGQIIVAMFLYARNDSINFEMINYLPVLLVSAIITGCLVAFVSSLIMKRLEKIIDK